MIIFFIQIYVSIDDLLNIKSLFIFFIYYMDCNRIIIQIVY